MSYVVQLIPSNVVLGAILFRFAVNLPFCNACWFFWSVCGQCKICYTKGEKVIFAFGLEVLVSTYDERLTAVERTITSLRNDFLQAIIENTHSMSTLNKVVLQQEQNTRDANHEITILTGVISAQGRDIKEMKNRLESFDQRFTSLEERFDQRFTSLDGKLEQVVQLLTTPPKTDK